MPFDFGLSTSDSSPCTRRGEKKLSGRALKYDSLHTDSAKGRLYLSLAAVALVLIRSTVFLCYEQNFDSDQAIVGLMAKHLSEFRAFPLFFYGQNYMLGVEAWIAVPFFWLARPTVTALRFPLLLVNIAVVLLLMRLFVANGLRPVLAFVAVLPIAACGPIASAQLLTALGASVEPLLYVIVLWLLRKRPVAFGILLCIGSLHREFTLFALPPIALFAWLEHRRVTWRPVTFSLIAFAATWILIDQLKRHLNIVGPPTVAPAENGSLVLEAAQVGRLLSFQPALYLARLNVLLTQGLPDLFGGRPLPLFTGGIWGEGSVGWRVAGVSLGVALAVCVARLFWLCVRGRVHDDVAFAVFLVFVGVEALAAYGLHGGTLVETRTELNYVLLVLLLPVGLVGAYLQRESRDAIRAAVVVCVLVWAAAMTVDNVRVTRQYLVNPPASPHRALTDALVRHGIKYGYADYWDSYRVTFLSKERVIVASTSIVRVPAYQERVERNTDNAVRIERQPCGEGARISEWCVVDPWRRIE